MLLGKRTRHPIKRTASMTGITVDLLSNVEDIVQQSFISHDPPRPLNHPFHDFPKPNFAYDQRLLAMVSLRNPDGVGSSGFTTNHVLDNSAPFLRSCCLCKRRLAPGQCREQQMKQDETREKWDAVASNKEGRHA
ncbi:Thioesterase superfamily protein [Gossypium australe]|uniref:Thioesterase superfamily protein n=1 Tax=Gossypium australe TaxID=47621 RepID=A0A5B6UXF7_9ROSI|nr:Thioesterase superfamily protein [Gossypium australe]